MADITTNWSTELSNGDFQLTTAIPESCFCLMSWPHECGVSRPSKTAFRVDTFKSAVSLMAKTLTSRCSCDLSPSLSFNTLRILKSVFLRCDRKKFQIDRTKMDGKLAMCFPYKYSIFKRKRISDDRKLMYWQSHVVI